MENRLVAARGWGWVVGVNGKGGVKRYKPPDVKSVSPGDVKYSLVIIVNNTVLRI